MKYPTTWLQGASLGERIACELRLQIIRGMQTPGTVLSENQIATDFGTSRSPVREAIKVLSSEGLIRLERMGAVVIGMTPDDMEELFDVRILIEHFVVQRYVHRDNTILVNTLNQMIDKMEVALKHRDIAEFSLQDFNFHEALVLEAGHTRILHTWNGMRQLILTVMLAATEQRFASNIEESQVTIHKHRTFANALKQGNEQELSRLIEEHYRDTRNAVNDSVLSSYRRTLS
ncbi:GntR family transcriptional regulator [Paenibacillus polymyxa]|uniref:GntR family transcriptional regulator n=1 Tax=Paenibacillus TaxID=44249 RepID=UPI000F50350E|nr:MULTISPECIES: GntR family transcriptional regulator [Paenibacillus]KAF6652352.1 GntR family transcriptional regulator [Paenibacillus sp. EKM301P]RPE10988.1 GntR family transcriptional regulator [Paenibacillus polymyxa]UBS87722.1 GntR family transcriptional regulator [Paenibacillus polymyxa]WHX36310.1 GntR family transcriptional regulator [Paenibacillus polymyxa]